MKRPSKLTKPESQKKKRLIKFDDRFNDLPEHIIHHIFSFLGDNDLFSLSKLSKKIGKLCISSPYLSFLGDFKDSCIKGCTKACKKFTTYLDDFFGARDNTMKLHSFSLKWECMEDNNEDSDKESLLDSWINTALLCKVEVLNLELKIKLGKRGLYVLPEYIFKSQSLRVLKLKINVAQLKLGYNDFSSLQDLELSNVGIIDDHLGEKISNYCKSLRKLSLKFVCGVSELRISSSSLEDFSCWNSYTLEYIKISAEKLHTLSGRWTSRFREMDVFAPNLRTFIWRGAIVRKFSGNFMAVENADICCETDWYKEFEIKDDIFATLVEFVQSVSHARVLQLHASVIEDLFLKDRLPLLFENVENLVVHVACLRDRQTPAIVSFLRGLPNLKTLQIKRKKHCFDPRDSKYTELLLKARRNEKRKQDFKHLEEVEIEIGRSNPETLVKYLVKHAKGLKKMTVSYKTPFHDVLSRRGFQCSDSASSSSSLCFQKKSC